jgi:adenylate cyclase
VLFADIRGFTSLSEGMAPTEIVRLLNRYFAAMVEVIRDQGGTVDKYVGDAIMALFGAPDPLPNAAAAAARAALGMRQRLAALYQDDPGGGGAALAIGIGLHYGPAAVGIIGAPSKREYSAIGDTVNTASRLEGFTKDSGYGIVASGEIVDRLPADLLAGMTVSDLGLVALRGRAARIQAFGLAEGQGDGRARPRGVVEA